MEKSKKIISMALALCTVLSAASTAAFAADEIQRTSIKIAAVDESTQIKNAIKAIRSIEKTADVYNDMTPDAFLKAMAKVIPEDSDVTLSFDKETDYRIWNATSQKDGMIVVNILFTCGVYKQHEMFDMKIPMFTGEAAIANADNEKVEEDASAVNARIKTIAVTNDSTKEEILEIARETVKNGSTVEWEDDFEMVNSTKTAVGSIKGTLRLTLNSSSKTVSVSKLIRLDIPENQNIKRTLPKSQSQTPAEPEKQPEATDKPSEPQKTAPVFTDVADSDYFAKAVAWAVEKNITAGTTNTTFSPADTCTRAQILTFLWRAVGSPKATAANPFSDVTENDYYYDAAIWASEKGMVTGDKFEGNTPCTRSSTVTYLWMNADAPDAIYADEFEDVDEDADYAEAVAWAVDNEITSGTSETEFSPDAICSRGQIVTFLNRAIK